MATLTTHLLDSVNGTHAAGMAVTLHRIDSAGGRTLLFSGVTDAGGRLRETVALAGADAGMTCELVFQVADYFARHPASMTTAVGNAGILREAVFRFSMPDPDGAYHIPMMVAPNSYSVWCSS